MQIVRSKIFISVISVLIVMSVLALWREISNTLKVKKEVARLEQQARDLEEKNQQLKALSEYLTSDAYKERAARENLNMQLPGEVAVALPSPDSLVAGDQAVRETVGVDENKSNPRAWFDYFFGVK